MSVFSRKPATRKPNKVIRIYTEGGKTEPNYFNAIKSELRLNEIDIKVYGLGDHTMSLVERANNRKEEEGGNKKKDDDSVFETEWWVVFDKDDHDRFNDSIEFAISKGIKVAYSNECFELWFILHFEFLQTAIGRDNCYDKIGSLLGIKYDKSKSDIYEMIKDKESVAIRNAKKLEKQHDEEDIKSFQERVPSTLVYKLVERLRALKEENSRNI